MYINIYPSFPASKQFLPLRNELWSVLLKWAMWPLGLLSCIVQEFPYYFFPRIFSLFVECLLYDIFRGSQIINKVLDLPNDVIKVKYKITIFINERSIDDREQCNPFDKLTLQFTWLSFTLPPCWIHVVRTVWLVYLHIFLMGIHNEINILVFIVIHIRVMNAMHFERVGKILCQKDKVSHPKETFLLDVLLIHGSESEHQYVVMVVYHN